jgi:NTE family protein
MKRPRIGLALGSGSARGWAHIGVIESLSEAGIAPDVICGTSIGSLVGAAYVAGRLTELRQWAEAVTWRDIVKLLDVSLTGGGLIDGKLVVKFLRKLGIEGAIEGYAIPFAAIATELVTGREVWLQSGPIHEAIRASITIPGILSPPKVGGKWLLDGGLVNPVPVSVCRALGADIIIAVNLNGYQLGRRFDSGVDEDAEPAPPPFLGRMLSQLPLSVRGQAMQMAARLVPQGPSAPGYFDVLVGAIDIMQDHITRTRLAGEPPHAMLAPRLRDIGLMQFDRAKEAIAEGRACVEEAMPMLRRLL